MSFLKGVFSGNPGKSAAKHERRARSHQAEGNDIKAADEWAAAGRDYKKIPDYQRAYEAFSQAAQFYLAVNDHKRETEILFDAVDAAIANQDYTAASIALDQVTRIGTRNRDDQLQIRAYSLQTLLPFAANDLAKSKRTFREAEKIKKRLGRKKIKTAVYQIASFMVNRFIEGNIAPPDIQLPSRVDESDTINQLVSTLLTLYQHTQSADLKLTLDKQEVKIKESVSGYATISFSLPTRIIDTQLSLPSNIALLEAIQVPQEPKKKFKIPFYLDPRLPGTFNVGPLIALFQVEQHQFQFKSNPVKLEITAAKPRINLVAGAAFSPHSQEEFELTIRVENNSHGDAADLVIAISLPDALLLKTGTLEKRIITLPAQQHVQFPLIVIATKTGTHEGTVICHYQGPNGSSQKVEINFSIEILPRIRKEKD
jgi:tetratricopeptide (TPR) repeat protein